LAAKSGALDCRNGAPGVLIEHSDQEIIDYLSERGYIVRYKHDAQAKVLWNRLEPIPADVDFKAEALEKLKEQITVDHVHFGSRPTTDGKTVRVATLRLF
jgi:hypothetical protein